MSPWPLLHSTPSSLQNYVHLWQNFLPLPFPSPQFSLPPYPRHTPSFLPNRHTGPYCPPLPPLYHNYDHLLKPPAPSIRKPPASPSLVPPPHRLHLYPVSAYTHPHPNLICLEEQHCIALEKQLQSTPAELSEHCTGVNPTSKEAPSLWPIVIRTWVHPVSSDIGFEHPTSPSMCGMLTPLELSERLVGVVSVHWRSSEILLLEAIQLLSTAFDS
ncbi:hypothetical protein AMTR_s00041p00118810 [Amborella trichopoda]|uniref:Uncharacterized protein n=1 Tax=Amborella trichopoda TaxID=13333 RepID=W1PTJ6_AMBTC|nr:hypothetical protein AMTR_s00041p00118810 [Amborella trichopoda]